MPWNAIEIDAVPPTGADSIGNTDDWLTYVFTHEYAHVLHLDRSVGWAVLARALFGRTVIGFPNLSLPLWQIEGFATLVESEGGQGRLHAGDFREIVDAGARAGRAEPLDRVNGGLIAWPSGQGWYAYGARFQEFLVARYGRERLVELANRTAARIPFITSGAFKAVYGKSLGELWREFEADGRRTSPVAPPTRLTPPTQLPTHAPRLHRRGSSHRCRRQHLVLCRRRAPFSRLYRLPAGAAAARPRHLALRRQRPLARTRRRHLRPARSHARRGADERPLRLRSPHRPHTTAHARRAPGRSRLVAGRHAAGRGSNGPGVSRAAPARRRRAASVECTGRGERASRPRAKRR